MTTAPPFRLHLVGLPHSETLKGAEFSWDAFSTKVVRFAEMMTPRGHEVILYGGERNDAPVAEHVTIFTSAERQEFYGDSTWDAVYDPKAPSWRAWNIRCAKEILRRYQPGDLVLVIGGRCQVPLQEMLGWDVPVVELGIGYQGTFSRYRVFESQAWRHHIGGAEGGWDPDGRFYDAVIPHYFNPDEFGPAGARSSETYLLFVGRLIHRKGVGIAAAVAEYLGVELVIAGTGPDAPEYGTKVGHIGPDQRRTLMAGAAAVFAPSLYLEPFGQVSIEALLSGAPAITTDFGAYTETIAPEWRCRTMAEFVDAARRAMTEGSAARQARRDAAIARFGDDAVAPMYERYLTQIRDWHAGRFWDHLPGPLDAT